MIARKQEIGLQEYDLCQASWELSLSDTLEKLNLQFSAELEKYKGREILVILLFIHRLPNKKKGK